MLTLFLVKFIHCYLDVMPNENIAMRNIKHYVILKSRIHGRESIIFSVCVKSILLEEKLRRKVGSYEETYYD